MHQKVLICLFDSDGESQDIHKLYDGDFNTRWLCSAGDLTPDSNNPDSNKIQFKFLPGQQPTKYKWWSANDNETTGRTLKNGLPINLGIPMNL